MTRTRGAAVVVALVPALLGVLCGPALAGWSSTRTAASGLETAHFVYPDGALEPPAPVADRAEDGSVTLSWPETVLSGDDARPMTDYVVTAVTQDGHSVQRVQCHLVVAPVVTCTGVSAALAEAHGFTVRPAFGWWVGPASAPSAPVPGATEQTTPQGEPPAQDPSGAEASGAEPSGTGQAPASDPATESESESTGEPPAASEPSGSEAPGSEQPVSDGDAAVLGHSSDGAPVFGAEPEPGVLLAAGASG